MISHQLLKGIWRNMIKILLREENKYLDLLIALEKQEWIR